MHGWGGKQTGGANLGGPRAELCSQSLSSYQTITQRLQLPLSLDILPFSFSSCSAASGSPAPGVHWLSWVKSSQFCLQFVKTQKIKKSDEYLLILRSWCLFAVYSHWELCSNKNYINGMQALQLLHRYDQFIDIYVLGHAAALGKTDSGVKVRCCRFQGRPASLDTCWREGILLTSMARAFHFFRFHEEKKNPVKPLHYSVSLNGES